MKVGNDIPLGELMGGVYSPLDFISLSLSLVLLPLMTLIFLLDGGFKIPKMEKCFFWQVLYGRVNTLDRLLKKLTSFVGADLLHSVSESRGQPGSY